MNRNSIKGSWVIDEKTTMAKNGTSMFRIYGTGFKYGSEMNIHIQRENLITLLELEMEEKEVTRLEVRILRIK